MRQYPNTTTKTDFTARDKNGNEFFTLHTVNEAVREYLRGNTVVYSRVTTRTEMDNRNITTTTTLRQWEPLPEKEQNG